MALEDRYNLEDVTNHAEQLVFNELEHQLRTRELPSFILQEECILDIVALALNKIRPMYRATLLGRMYEHALEEEYALEVQNAVTQAIEKIVSNPPA